jgi:hypothetical protein
MGTQQQHIDSFLSRSPLIEKIRILIFGEDQPDKYTKVTFYISIVIWLIFFVWSCASYLAISFRQMIMEEKNVPVEKIIIDRGEQLGFEGTEFLDRLLTFHSISIICWISVLVGLVFLWRKDLRFVWFYFGGTVFYLGMMIFYLNYSYFRNDTTFFDKIAFLTLNANALMYYFMLRKEKSGGSLNFFGEEDDEE